MSQDKVIIQCQKSISEVFEKNLSPYAFVKTPNLKAKTRHLYEVLLTHVQM